MKNQGSFTMDFKQFEKEFKRIAENAIPQEAGKGLFKAGNELLQDAVKEPPQAPKKKGKLWGSKRVTKAEVKKGEISVKAGFNIVYAARWHEAEPNINWTTTKGASQPGPKYLESKMGKYKNKYMEITADHIKGNAR